MKKLQLFAMLTLLSTGFITQAKVALPVDENSSWSNRHLERTLNSEAAEGVMTHPGLSRYISRVNRFLKEAKEDSEVSSSELAYLTRAVGDLQERFDSDQERYSDLKNRIKTLTEKTEAFLATQEVADVKIQNWIRAVQRGEDPI